MNSRSQQPFQYWRSTSGFEVDFVVAKGMAIEVKASELVQNKHIKGLKALKGPDAAEILIDRMEQNLTHLETHPFLGRAPNDVDLADLGYCYLIVYDYLIFYTIQRSTILAHRIIHGARDYKDLLADHPAGIQRV